MRHPLYNDFAFSRFVMYIEINVVSTYIDSHFAARKNQKSV